MSDSKNRKDVQQDTRVRVWKKGNYYKPTRKHLMDKLKSEEAQFKKWKERLEERERAAKQKTAAAWECDSLKWIREWVEEIKKRVLKLQSEIKKLDGQL